MRIINYYINGMWKKLIEFDASDIKKIRTLKVFINAAAKIIEEEGIDKVTIRKVANIAGYNSATIYNYFDNCNQLVFFAATKFLRDYVKNLPDYLEQSGDIIEKFLLIWESFCKHSFEKPQIYYAIFTDDIGDKSENLISKYYQIFPEELGNPPDDLVPMLKETDFPKRCSIAIQPLVEKGYLTSEKAREVDERIRLIYHGMLSLYLNNRVPHSPQEASEQVMKHIRTTLDDAIKNGN